MYNKKRQGVPGAGEAVSHMDTLVPMWKGVDCDRSYNSHSPPRIKSYRLHPILQIYSCTRRDPAPYRSTRCHLSVIPEAAHPTPTRTEQANSQLNPNYCCHQYSWTTYTGTLSVSWIPAEWPEWTQPHRKAYFANVVEWNPLPYQHQEDRNGRASTNHTPCIVTIRPRSDPMHGNIRPRSDSKHKQIRLRSHPMHGPDPS